MRKGCERVEKEQMDKERDTQLELDERGGRVM